MTTLLTIFFRRLHLGSQSCSCTKKREKNPKQHPRTRLGLIVQLIVVHDFQPFRAPARLHVSQNGGIDFTFVFAINHRQNNGHQNQEDDDEGQADGGIALSSGFQGARRPTGILENGPTGVLQASRKNRPRTLVTQGTADGAPGIELVVVAGHQSIFRHGHRRTLHPLTSFHGVRVATPLPSTTTLYIHRVLQLETVSTDLLASGA